MNIDKNKIYKEVNRAIDRKVAVEIVRKLDRD